MNKSILLIITGSVAAYKSLDVIRRLRERKIEVTCVLTKGGAEFVTPLSVGSLSERPVYSDLFSLKDETEMGHIRLSRENDLIVVAPASADIIAKMATGRADDLATSTLLASDKPILVVPAMNTRMWEHPATKRNLAQLAQDGVQILAPGSGELACGEIGAGRLAEVTQIVDAIVQQLEDGKVKSEEGSKPLRGLSALVTSGPTYEAIDPVRFIGNRSSGKQGYAIAEALVAAGADVTLVTGPTAQPDIKGALTIHVETAEEMLAACTKALPAEVAVCTAAVSDWRVKNPFDRKIKKRANETPPAIELVPNPDILQTLSNLKKKRPMLVIGFAAETEALKKNATEKRRTKGCDWIVANDVSWGKVFGSDETSALFVTATSTEEWKDISKQELAETLVHKIAKHLGRTEHGKRTARIAPAR